MKIRLFTPGPVEIPQRILRALSQVPPHHRTDVFRDTLRRVVETAPVKDLFRKPVHPYTEGLLAAIPKLDVDVVRLPTIASQALVPT